MFKRILLMITFFTLMITSGTYAFAQNVTNLNTAETFLTIRGVLIH
jgi:hypothetical protein